MSDIYPDPVESETGELDEQDLAALIANEIRSAVDYDASELSKRRKTALEYYRGEMSDVQARPNGSTVTSRDLADTMSWMLPGIMRVFLASDHMGEYEPCDYEGSPEQAEEYAQQATDYINYVFFRDNDGYRTVYNATHDSLLTGNGIIKHYWDDLPEEKITIHSRLTVEQIAELQQDGDVEILAQEENPEPDLMMDPATGEAVPVQTYNIKVKRVIARGRLRIEAVAPEHFLIDVAAITIENCRFAAQCDPYATRSDLIERGFDREKVDALAADNSVGLTAEDDWARRRNGTMLTNSLLRSTDRIELYECYIKADVDGDGIAEVVQVWYAGDAGAGTVLEWQVWEDDLPFSLVPCYPIPHRFDADAVSDRTIDVQKIKTILHRQALDNLYASNLPMREVEVGSVENPDILVSPKFGGLIWKKRGTAPIVPHTVPFVADKAFIAAEYFDRVIEKRTGVSRSMMALDPEALQNQSATANQNARDASYSQIELVARNMAELGWKRVFSQLLKLTVKHQDRARIIRLRGQFIESDPRSWNAEMNVAINVGLGTGSRDRDMAMLMSVLQSQYQLLGLLQQAGFANQALDMGPKIRRTLVKIAESSGLKNPEAFYPEFEDAEIEQMRAEMQQRQGQPTPEMQLEMAKMQASQQMEQAKMQAEMQAERARLEMQREAEVLKAQGNQVKEQAQLDADMQVRAAEREQAIALAAADAELKREDMALRERIERARLETQLLIAGLRQQKAMDAPRPDAQG